MSSPYKTPSIVSFRTSGTFRKLKPNTNEFRSSPTDSDQNSSSSPIVDKTVSEDDEGEDFSSSPPDDSPSNRTQLSDNLRREESFDKESSQPSSPLTDVSIVSSCQYNTTDERQPQERPAQLAHQEAQDSSNSVLREMVRILLESETKVANMHADAASKLAEILEQLEKLS